MSSAHDEHGRCPGDPEISSKVNLAWAVDFYSNFATAFVYKRRSGGLGVPRAGRWASWWLPWRGAGGQNAGV